MTKEQMADALALELIDDIEALGNSLMVFNDRWATYGKQYRDLVSVERRDQLERALLEWMQKIEDLVA